MVAAAQGSRRVSSNGRAVDGLIVMDSPVWADDRGFFREWFRLADLNGAGFTARQANLSRSVRGVVRGLHYSLAPEGQAKVVTCVDGTLEDVIVDVRVGSPTFGAVEVVTLAGELGRSVLLPAGVAHGFCVTSEVATLAYLLSSPYNAALRARDQPLRHRDRRSRGRSWASRSSATRTPPRRRWPRAAPRANCRSTRA